MDLRDFVSETLIQIAEGVRLAQERSKDTGVKVSPRLGGNAQYAADHGFLATATGPAQIVKFDVALTVKDASDSKGGIGIFAGAISIGGSAQSTQENATVNRIQFAVPMVLPQQA